jgi:hypothetical protein
MARDLPTGIAGKTPTAIGAAVMALGIFIAASLPHIPDGALLMQPMAALLLLLWAVFAARLLASIGSSGIAARSRPVPAMFGIGTWVAGTAIVSRVLMLAWPTVAWPPQAFWAASLALWLWFFPQALRNLARLATDAAARPTGIVLLTTVATQAVAEMAFRLFAAPAIRWGAALLLALGAACYLGGAYLVLRRYLARRDWSLATDWDNTNCILHGALSITGLTAVVSGSFDADRLLALWLCVLAVLVAVEAIEAMRLCSRLQRLDWRIAVARYHVSQWARNFTFGMFYAFTETLAEQLRLGAAPALLRAVLGYGQYLVLALLLLELGLAAAALIARPAPTV